MIQTNHLQLEKPEKQFISELLQFPGCTQCERCESFSLYVDYTSGHHTCLIAKHSDICLAFVCVGFGQISLRSLARVCVCVCARI